MTRPRDRPSDPRGKTFAAVDLGAGSGRVALGTLDGSRLEFEVPHRFQNRPVELPDGLHWNLLALFTQVLDGLARCAADRELGGVGIDSWGVDYAPLDARGRLLGLPFHYRDRRTDGMVERAFARISPERLYARTGIQTLPFNTVFQLMADEGTPAAGAERIALVPDLIAYWLTGECANEVTIASTTGLLDAETGTWALDVVDELELPARPFADAPVEPGTPIGTVLARHGMPKTVPVRAVGCHDTASAFAAVPLTSSRAAILSSGTWSLLGMELERPVLTADAAQANLTNERGVNGTTRLLKNVMGLWLLEECRRQWAAAGDRTDYEQLVRLAEQAPPDVPLVDPDLELFLPPGDMPARIAEACRVTGQPVPRDVGETVRSIFASLACKYRVVLETLERVTGRRAEVLHVVGGGARNALLCQLTADILRIPVVAGPVEATAIGNILVQARAAGELGSLAEMRSVVAASFEPTLFTSGDTNAGTGTYQRFVEVWRPGDREPTAVVAGGGR